MNDIYLRNEFLSVQQPWQQLFKLLHIIVLGTKHIWLIVHMATRSVTRIKYYHLFFEKYVIVKPT